MNKLNKLVTNYPVSLTPEEVENLSETLSAVHTAKDEGKTYSGEGFVNVNNTNNTISLTTEANEKLNQPIPTKVSDLTDSASYQTTAGMDDYLTKTSASENLAPLSVTADIESLKNASGDFSLYYKKTETSSTSELDTAFGSKQDNLTQEQLSAISSVSSIKGTILTGDSNIRTTSAEDGNNIKWTLELTAQPVVTDTTLSGYDGIVATKDSTVSSQWNIGIAQAYKEQIEAVSSKLTQNDADALYAPISVTGDVDTLKSSSGDWNKVSAKLDTSAFSSVSGNFVDKSDLNDYATKSDLETTSGELLTTAQYQTDSATFLTAHQSLDNYYTKTQVDSTFASATQLNNYLTTTQYNEDSATFALKSEIPTTVAQLTDSGNYYQKTETSSNTEITNALNTKVDKPTSTQSGKLVYDGDTSAWVSLPAGTTTIVQGQGSVTANYDSSNSTYTVSLLASAEESLNKVDDKIDTTAVAQTYQTKSDMTNYLTTSDASTTYQPIGDYATTSDISDMATQTWVGQQGFYTKASGDNDYAPKSVTAIVDTLTGASADWNEVSSKLDKSIYSNASGNWENTYNVVNQYSAAGTWLTAHQSLTSYYTKSETSGATELSAEFAKYVTSSNVTTQDTDYVMTTTGWKVLTLPGGGMTQVIHDTTLTGQGNADDSKLGVAWSALSGNTIDSALSAGSATSALSADKAASASASKRLQDSTSGPIIQVGDITALQNWASSNSSTWDEVSSKVNIPDTTQTDLNNNYLIYSTLTGAGTTTGWMPLSANYYSKTEANGTFIATANIDTSTLSGDGKSSGTKLGVKTDAIATRDYVNSSFLPTSGGTVSGELVVSATTGTFDSSYVKCVNDGTVGYSRFGVGSSGEAIIKAVNGNDNVQVNVKYNANNNELVQVQKDGADIGFLIPAVTATTTAGLTNDGILHIILES